MVMDVFWYVQNMIISSPCSKNTGHKEDMLHMILANGLHLTQTKHTRMIPLPVKKQVMKKKRVEDGSS